MRIDFSRGVPERKRANVRSRPVRKALAFVALGPSLLMVTGLLIFALFGRSTAHGQTQGATSQANNAGSANPQPVGTMSDVMTSMVYPAANNILLAAYRGGAQDDKEWLAIQRSAVLLAESGNVLVMRGPAVGQSDWAKDAKMLSEAGAAAYKAARAKDANALMAVAQPLNAACTACHKQYRANIAGPSHQPAE
jgi:hypothetical protein